MSMLSIFIDHHLLSDKRPSWGNLKRCSTRLLWNRWIAGGKDQHGKLGCAKMSEEETLLYTINQNGVDILAQYRITSRSPRSDANFDSIIRQLRKADLAFEILEIERSLHRV